MATMIPPRYDTGTSSAEQHVFERLRSDPDTLSWTVMHSLALSRRGRKPYGEIDFVVLIPEEGIVCIEVKGGRVSCRDGVWRTQDRFGHESPLNRSPFQQAREGMFALRDAIRQHFGTHDTLSATTIASLVIFPDVAAPPLTTEFESWECVDVTRFRHPISRSLREVLRRQRERVGGNGLESSAKRLRSFLRPDFDVVIARATTIARSEERLLALTEDQYEVLDTLEQNDRCLVEGAAGTGKTLLALEYAKRAAANGRRIVLLCFNRMLGDWLSERASESEATNLISAGSYHRILRDLIVRSSYGDEFLARESEDKSRSLFEEAYSFYGELALGEIKELPDAIIVDEAQDLMSPGALAVINSWLKGGLAGGRWALFGDFTRQAIYSEASNVIPSNGSANNLGALEEVSRDRIRGMLRDHVDHFASLILRRNCRNTRPIGEETALLSGFDSLPYRLDAHDALAVDYRWFRDRGNESGSLRNVLAMLTRDNVVESDIVILSPLRFEHSVAADLADDTEYRVAPGTSAPRGRTRIPTFSFSTIHAFKGMESPVVILCDIERLSGNDAEALLYVGMSRARSHLVMLVNERLKGAVQSAFQRRLSAEWAE